MSELSSASDVMDALESQDAQFPVDSEIGEKDADDVLENEKEGEDGKTRIGTLIISTTGGGSTLQVPHAELKRKMKELGFTEGVIPSPTPPNKAFTRAKNEILESLDQSVEFDGNIVDFDIKSDGYYEQYPVAEFIEDGEVKTVTLGKIWYDPDTEAVYYDSNDEIKGTSLADVWGLGFKKVMEERFAYHQSHLIADDIAELQRRLHEKAPHSIKLRRAVYFYPALTSDLDGVLEMYRNLYNWLDDNYKLRGESTDFYWTPMFNRDADKEFVTEKLEESLRDEIQEVVDEVINQLTDDETAEEIARDVLKPALSQMDSTVEEYEAISESTPRVRRMLKEVVRQKEGELADRAEEIINDIQF